MTRFFRHSTHDDEIDALDDALERLRLGDRSGVEALRPGLARTVDQVFGVAGAPVRQTRPAGSHRRSPGFRQWASIAATALLAFVVGFGAHAFAIGTWFDDPDGPATIPAAGSAGEVIVTPAATPVVDCTGSPRTWDEVMAILATPPGVDGSVGTQTERNSEIGLLAGLETAINTWQDCHNKGQTLGAMAYTSERSIRRLVYGSARMDEPLSTATLGELLNARIALDARVAASTGYAAGLTFKVDPESVLTSPDGTSAQAVVRHVNPTTGVAEAGPWTVTFILEDGTWRIDDTEFDAEW